MKLKIMLLFLAMVLVMMTVAAAAYAKERSLPPPVCFKGKAAARSQNITQSGPFCTLVNQG
jgi:hypothetical protein